MKCSVAPLLAVWFSLSSCGTEPVSATCPAVLPGWTTPSDGMDPHGIYSTVTMAGEQAFWDGRPVDAAELQRLLRLAPALSPVDHVLFDPKGAASCRDAERLRDQIDRLAECHGKGLCGQGDPRDFIRLRDSGAVWRVKERR